MNTKTIYWQDLELNAMIIMPYQIENITIYSEIDIEKIEIIKRIGKPDILRYKDGDKLIAGAGP